MGPVLAMTQALSPPAMRATASALLMLIINLFGLGLGPLVIGLLSDALAATLDKESLRAALALAPVAALWAAVHFFLAARTLREDIDHAERVVTAG
jgi:MFS family permease